MIRTLHYKHENNTILISETKPYDNCSLVAVQDENTDYVIIEWEGNPILRELYSDYLNGDNGGAAFGVDVASTLTALNAFLAHNEADFRTHIDNA